MVQVSPLRHGAYVTLHYGRAIAALSVTAYHASGNLTKDTYFGRSADGLASLFHFGGAAGVAFFFVLSGFIISHVHWQDIGKPTALTDYLHKRLARVYPPFVVVFLAVYIAAWLTPSLRATVPHDLMVLLKALLLIPQDPALVGGLGSPVIIVAWSLHFEIVFYLVFALALIDLRLFAGTVLGWAGWVAYGQWVGFDQFPATFFGNGIAVLFCSA